MSQICPGCQLRIDPIFVFDRSPKTGKEYLITKCPRERCGFNLDIELAIHPKSPKGKDNEGRFFWKDLLE